MASAPVRVWSWPTIASLAAVAWTGFAWRDVPTWLLFVGLVVVLLCLAQLYRVLGDDEILPEPVRSRLRRHVLFFGPAGALEALLVSYGHR